MNKSTGSLDVTPLATSSCPQKIPPEMAHEPTAITSFGFGIAS